MHKGFFAALYDISFSEFVIPRIIKVIYVIGLVALALAMLSVVIAAFGSSVGLGIVTLLIFAPLGFLVYSILMRVYLEVVMVLFRIHENTTEQVRLLSGQAQTGGQVGPGGVEPPTPIG